MSKKFGLGKGLNALIPEELITPNKENEVKEKSMTIDINLIKGNKEQPRKKFDDEKIIELAESIKHHGVVQPILLKKENDKYIIIAGERRWRASKLAGLKSIPAVIMDITEKELLEISLIENIQRQDLNAIEEAVAFKKLLSDFNLTQEELSKRLGKSRVAITNTIRLLNLSKDVQQYLIEGVISEGHGRALLSISDDKLQYELSQKVIDDKLSVRELENIVKNIKNGIVDKRVKQNKEANPYYKDITDKLQNYFGTKVSLRSKNNKGKIEIEYYSEEDLQRILEIIEI